MIAKQIFEKYDKDGNGVIDRKEAKPLFTDLFKEESEHFSE